MNRILNQRGSIIEFTLIAPMVISLALVVMQLMFLFTQREQSRAAADRIAFLAATLDKSAAAFEAQRIMTSFPAITDVAITNNPDLVKVEITATAKLFLPIPELTYQIEAEAVKEP